MSTWDFMSPSERAACVDAGRLPDLDAYEAEADWRRDQAREGAGALDAGDTPRCTTCGRLASVFGPRAVCADCWVHARGSEWNDGEPEVAFEEEYER